jgi:hypothetical protein
MESWKERDGRRELDGERLREVDGESSKDRDGRRELDGGSWLEREMERDGWIG